MKKIFISLLAIIACANISAINYSAMAVVTLTDQSSHSSELILIQSDDLNDGYNNGWCGEIYDLSERTIAFYSFYNSKNYESFGTKEFGNMPLGLKTGADGSYTLTVSGVVGTETLVIRDNQTGDLFNLTEGATYNFTATANDNTTARFQLYVAPSTPEICHRYGKLQVSGSNGQSVVVKNMDDSATSIGTVAITADYQEISLAGLAAGQYKVEWNSQTLIIDVK